jgi:hypothetical protein
LIQAFIRVRHQLAGFHLVFEGPDGGMLEQLRHMAEQAGISGCAHFWRQQAMVDGIGLGLMQLLGNGDVLPQIAPQWLDFVKRQFTWDAIGPAYVQLYKSIQVGR